MTRLELLRLVVARARKEGFEFRRWYTQRLQLPWISTEAALTLLDNQRRYYALIFSHEFACAFWAPGSEILLELPAQTYDSVMPDGTVRAIARRGHIRRSARREVWRYHLKQMALAEEPLRYLRRFLPVEDQLDAESEHAPQAKAKPVQPRRSPLRAPKPLPAEPPAFLQRPYGGTGPAAATVEMIARLPFGSVAAPGPSPIVPGSRKP